MIRHDMSVPKVAAVLVVITDGIILEQTDQSSAPFFLSRDYAIRIEAALTVDGKRRQNSIPI